MGFKIPAFEIKVKRYRKELFVIAEG